MSLYFFLFFGVALQSFYQLSLIFTDISFFLPLQPSPVFCVQHNPFLQLFLHNLIILKPDIVLTSNSQFSYLLCPVGFSSFFISFLPTLFCRLSVVWIDSCTGSTKSGRHPKIPTKPSKQKSGVWFPRKLRVVRPSPLIHIPFC